MENLQKDWNLPFGEEPHRTRYLRFIKSRPHREFKLSTGVERHHILPRAFGAAPGYRDKDNVVVLTSREHYIAHLMLWKCYGLKMASAFWFMSHLKGLRLTAKQYADLRQSMMKDRARTRGAKRSEEFKKRCSEYSKEREQKHREQGFQINFSKEVLKILSENGKELAQGNSLEGPQRERFLAAIRSEKVSQKKSEAFLKRKEAGMKREYIPQSEERIQHRAEKNRGQKRSEETKERMRQAAIEREKRKKEKKAASKEE